MYSDADLDAAVSAGVLTSGSAAEFRAFIGAQRSSSVVDEEHFRLLTGFNDIFVSIAILLILIALGWIGGRAAAEVGAALVAAASWGLAEYFTRRRRMALPSIVLFLGFAGAVFAGAPALVVHLLVPIGLPTGSSGTAVLLALVSGAAYLHWRRFMVPITVAVGSAVAAGTIISVVLVAVPGAAAHSSALILLGGMAIFALAMRWDASDPERKTRRSDVAFWLHLAAAPMMVHPAFALLGVSGIGALLPFHPANQPVDLGAAAAAIAIYLGLAAVALIIDRRALLVSALFYVLFALSTLFRAAGSLTFSLAFTSLVIGSGLLLLSAFWRRARILVLGYLPRSIRAKLPST